MGLWLRLEVLFGGFVGGSSGGGFLGAVAAVDEAGGERRHLEEDIERWAGRRRAREVCRRFAGLWIDGARRKERGDVGCFAIVLQNRWAPIMDRR